MTRGLRRLVAVLGAFCLLSALFVFAHRVAATGALYLGASHALSEWVVLASPRLSERERTASEVLDLVLTPEVQNRMSEALRNTRTGGVRMAQRHVTSKYALFSALLAALGVSLLVFCACVAHMEVAGHVRARRGVAEHDTVGLAGTGRRHGVRASLIMVTLGALFVLSSLCVLACRRSAEPVIHRGYDRLHREWVRLSNERPVEGSTTERRVDARDADWCSAHSAAIRSALDVISAHFLIFALLFAAPGVLLLVVSPWGQGRCTTS